MHKSDTLGRSKYCFFTAFPKAWSWRKKSVSPLPMILSSYVYCYLVQKIPFQLDGWQAVKNIIIFLKYSVLESSESNFQELSWKMNFWGFGRFGVILNHSAPLGWYFLHNLLKSQFSFQPILKKNKLGLSCDKLSKALAWYSLVTS